LGQLYTCIECDLMHGKKFQELLIAKDSRPIRMDVEGIEGERNMMKDQTAEGMSLKNSCANLLVVSTMARSEPSQPGHREDGVHHPGAFGVLDQRGECGAEECRG
jgi:hypothetical protein